MKQGYTVYKDSSGSPSLLIDCRTPIWEQEKAMNLLRSGQSEAPEDAQSVELICTERGLVSKWIRTSPNKIQKPKYYRKESK